MARKTELEKVEAAEAKSQAKRKSRKKDRRRADAGGKMRKNSQRELRRPIKPIPGARGRSSQEIEELDPHHPSFRHPQGRPRKRPDGPGFQKSFKDAISEHSQAVAREKRAEVRKRQALEQARKREVEPKGPGPYEGVDQIDVMYANGDLDIDDWDEEELLRGYQRNRYGRFGDPPKFVPREVQQAAMRRVIALGNRKLQTKFIEVMSQLAEMATGDDVPPKVKLDAMKELINRVGGKVPDVVVQTEAPWQDMLVDSVVPIDEVVPIEVRGRRVVTEAEGGSVPELPPAAATGGRAPVTTRPPSSGPRRRGGAGKKGGGKGIVKVKTTDDGKVIMPVVVQDGGRGFGGDDD